MIELKLAVPFAPVIGGIALAYGVAEMVSYSFNGMTLEQNILGK